MKIRTITTGINLQSPNELDKIKYASAFNQEAKKIFEKEGYEVQTTRIATNSWQEYFNNSRDEQILNDIIKIEKICKDLEVSFFNIGYADTPSKIDLLPRINKSTSIISCSAKLGDLDTTILFENVKASARVIKQISQETENGYGNFRFCAWANCKPGIPFFPVGYNDNKTSFAIGLECSDLIMQAFSKATNFVQAERNMKEKFEEKFGRIEKIAGIISSQLNIEFRGIDTSLAPSLEREESIAFAYEKLGIEKFGYPGTLAISSIVTRVLKSLSVKKCGYCGLMLPVCEDYGLAERANEETYGLTELLLYSAVCGCGLDTIPIPGNITTEKIEGILLDVASLALKLNKPLAARLFPVPGKIAGEMTEFNSPYMVNCKILKIT